MPVIIKKGAAGKYVNPFIECEDDTSTHFTVMKDAITTDSHILVKFNDENNVVYVRMEDTRFMINEFIEAKE